MSLRDKFKMKTDLPPETSSQVKPFPWQKLFSAMFIIGVLALLFVVPFHVIFFYSTVISMSVVLAGLLLFTLVMLTPLAELKPDQTSFRDRSYSLYRLIKLNQSTIVMTLLILGTVFSWAALGVPWVVEQIIGPYVCPPGYNDMTFKNSVTRLPIAGYAISYSFEGYCSGSLGIYRGIRLLHFFLGLFGAYCVLVLLCFIAVLIVRLLQPAAMVKSRTIGPNVRFVLVVAISLGLWAELLMLPKHAPVIPETVSRVFNAFSFYKNRYHSFARYGTDIDKLVMQLEAQPYGVNQKNKYKMTPLAVALDKNNVIVADMLRRYNGKYDPGIERFTGKKVEKSDYSGLSFEISREIKCGGDCDKNKDVKK